ncbi:hypothetical protein ACS0TY_006616 [Phlomoides rotata]
MLQRLGFSASFCDLISTVLHSTRLSVLINGVSCGYFACSRGVRQGDPLSPLLFCLAEEALDDILIFARITIGNIRRLQLVLSTYASLSGQIYNSSKLKVYFGSAVTRRVQNYMLSTTGVTYGSLPLSYLGVSIFRGAPRTC